MSKHTVTVLKTTSVNLLKVALVAALLAGLAASVPANLTRINPTAAVELTAAADGAV